MEMDVLDLQSYVAPLLQLCREAGDVICGHYNAPGADQFEAKGDDSPLTRADLDSHALLQAGLTALTPAIPVLSEESSAADQAQRRSWDCYWLVDPLDGTKEFLARTGEFTINIALIAQHQPVLGLLYLPLERVAYLGIPGVEACRYSCTDSGGWINSQLATRSLEAGQPLTVLASRRHGGPRLQACLEWLEEQWGPVARLNSGSALKSCQLAEGAGDLYPRFSPCCEWDTAAGQAVLEAAGGCLLDMAGQPLRYNCQESLLSPHFYAIADADHALWQRLLSGRRA